MKTNNADNFKSIYSNLNVKKPMTETVLSYLHVFKCR
jgi:hypothetical protein